MNELGDKSLGVFLYASALGRQFSYASKDWGNGAFTKAMIEGLAGQADRDNVGYVDTEELALFVRRRVLSMTKQQQEPVRIKPDATPELRIATFKGSTFEPKPAVMANDEPVRSAAAGDAVTMLTLKRGEPVTIKREAGSWSLIEHNGREVGFVPTTALIVILRN